MEQSSGFSVEVSLFPDMSSSVSTDHQLGHIKLEITGDLVRVVSVRWWGESLFGVGFRKGGGENWR